MSAPGLQIQAPEPWEVDFCCWSVTQSRMFHKSISSQTKTKMPLSKETQPSSRELETGVCAHQRNRCVWRIGQRQCAEVLYFWKCLLYFGCNGKSQDCHRPTSAYLSLKGLVFVKQYSEIVNRKNSKNKRLKKEESTTLLLPFFYPKFFLHQVKTMHRIEKYAHLHLHFSQCWHYMHDIDLVLYVAFLLVLYFCILLVLYFETKSHIAQLAPNYTSESGLELPIFLSPSPKCYDSRHLSPQRVTFLSIWFNIFSPYQYI